MLRAISYDLRMETREQSRNNKQTDTKVTKGRGFWLVKRTLGWKSFMPEELPRFKKSIDTSLWRNTATQLANRTMPPPYQVFFGGKTKSPCFDIFIPASVADKTNNEHLPTPFFKVIRKSLSLFSATAIVRPMMWSPLMRPKEERVAFILWIVMFFQRASLDRSA